MTERFEIDGVPEDHKTLYDFMQLRTKYYTEGVYLNAYSADGADTELVNTEYAKGAVYVYTEGTEELRYGHLIKVNPDKAGELFIIMKRTSSIAEQAFEGCSMIKKLVFTKDIKTDAIYSSAFAGLTALEEIYYDGNILLWSQYKNLPTADAKVLHHFAVKPLQTDLETYGLELSDCWHWKDNKEYTEIIVWSN